ncbi:MAG TPA: 5'-methylthioadenosine/adenosylhomocysteine nucleosidase [Ramlibacter sp.]|jgi:adenosylhomocysteine nucleosidase|uniref:5'-methylthioadenosine/adenosylhomocysteine nucleosidase n=1 Tax=Ramlibacter sp. TaxID=1917967 RepID=UPI002D698373|nr:5'-methylthioadenosine/adenosylhomocysteine nucleosidase [Ramlibacter sp.]HZY17287.1 5'-methylthioadenosine/adenosylhomocysteine nucleosidase [Ramlibacter sp.]
MTLAIVSAMHEELAAVLALLPHESRQQVAGREFWRGRLHGQEVVAVLSRIGKVAAATTATLLVERFAADRIVFTGVAGGLGPGVEVGHVVVADGFLQHDLDASPLFPRHEVPLYGISRFPTDPALTARLAAAAARALPGTPVHRGLVVSGDRFVATGAESRALQAALPDALAVEMEGAAIAQVCHDCGVAFAAVRTVSDRADDQAHVDFSRFVREVASRHSAAIVRELLA